MKATQQAIERGVKDCLFIDYKRRSGHFDVITVASIKEITEKVRLIYFASVTVDTITQTLPITFHPEIWKVTKNSYLGI